MQPMPCPHCGVNFMRRNTDCTQSEVCNNCTVREQIRNPKKDTLMETVDILIKISPKDYKQIEELCINKGISFTQYFMNFHLPAKQDSVVFVQRTDIIEEEEQELEETKKTIEQTNNKRKYKKRK